MHPESKLNSNSILSQTFCSFVHPSRRKDASEEETSETFYSDTIGSIWRTTLSVFEDEAKLISGTAFKITQLEKWLSTSKKTLENEIEMDDTAWKRVCDAARVEMRLESRYKQTKYHGEKVRQRVSSKEYSLSRGGANDFPDDMLQPQRKRNDSSGSIGFANRASSGIHSTPNKVGRAFFKGGEAFFKGGEAMKKFTENAMVQIAQIGINEVDQKVAKDQLALEEASAEKKAAVLAYALCTKERIEKIDAEDGSGWAELSETISKLAESVRALKRDRCTVYQNQISHELHITFQSLVANMEDWSKSVQEKIYQNERASSSTNVPEHALSMKQMKSDNIDPLLAMTETDLTIPKLKIEIESTSEMPKDGSTDSRDVIPIPPVASDVQGVDCSDSSGEEVEKSQGSVTTPSENKTNVSESEKEKLPSPVDNDLAVARKEESPEAKAFFDQFWSKKPEDEKMPTILDTYACAYRPKERMTFLTPNLVGRLYTTKEAIYFLAADNNFALHWERITSVEKEKGFMGANNDSDLVVSYRTGKTTSSFLLCRLTDRDGVVANLKRLKAEYGAENEEPEGSIVSENEGGTGPQLPPVPPDSLLENMEIVVARTIKNVSIRHIFENVWADRTEGESFYESWLKDEECFDIGMGEWEIAEPGAKFRNEWCNEKYDQQRLVTFKFNRTTHLYIGPPVAFVKQRHFLRADDNDRCVLAISAEFEGIPYADTFAVEMRWVATRMGTNDAQVQVGLFVNFKKSTMMKSQIKSGTITETKSVHLRLFDAVKKACKNTQDDKSDNNEDEEDEDEDEKEFEMKKAEQNLFAKLEYFASYLDGSATLLLIGVIALILAAKWFSQAVFKESSQSDIQRLESHIQELRNEVRALHKSIELVTLLVKEIGSNDVKNAAEYAVQ